VSFVRIFEIDLGLVLVSILSMCYKYCDDPLKRPIGALTMNKGELIDVVAEKAEVSKKDADAIVTATVEAIMEAVASGDKVSLVGFGSFEPRERKARDGRNPQTGKAIKIPATTVPAFSAGKGFKEMVASS
jgi:DNA-binding protein HU-beta